MIIGICGLIGAGKDTAADYLVNLHHFRRESFANTLKDAVAQVFGWDRTMLEGRTKHSREWREQVDAWWAERLGMPNLTPRWVLQYWGTNVLRTGFHDDIWIASLENKLRNSTDDVVITDCRFPNEIKAIKAAGGIVVRIQRGDEPNWYDAAVAYNRGPNGNSCWALSKQTLHEFGVHASEYSWIGTDFDQVIDNNGTLDHLYNQVMHLAQDPPSSTEDQIV
jgi:hypothetical protein